MLSHCWLYSASMFLDRMPISLWDAEDDEEDLAWIYCGNVTTVTTAAT